MKARGRFIGDKIDLLVSYLIVHPFLQLYTKLPQKVKVCCLSPLLLLQPLHVF